MNSNPIATVEEVKAALKKLLAWEPEKLKKIMFMDETMVKAYPNGEAVFYRASAKRDELVKMKMKTFQIK